MTRRANQHPAAASHKGQEPCTQAALKPPHALSLLCAKLWIQPAEMPGMNYSPCPQQQARLPSKCLVSICVPCEP